METAITRADLETRALRGLTKDQLLAAQQVRVVATVAERTGQVVGAVVAGRTYGDFQVGPVSAPQVAAAVALVADLFGLGGDGPIISAAKEAAYSAASCELAISQAVAAGKVVKV